MLKHSICFLNSKSRLSLKVCGHLCPTIETPPNVLKRREEAKKKKKKSNYDFKRNVFKYDSPFSNLYLCVYIKLLLFTTLKFLYFIFLNSWVNFEILLLDIYKLKIIS